MSQVKIHFKTWDLRGLRAAERFCFSNFLGGIHWTSMGQWPEVSIINPIS